MLDETFTHPGEYFQPRGKLHTNIARSCVEFVSARVLHAIGRIVTFAGCRIAMTKCDRTEHPVLNSIDVGPDGLKRFIVVTVQIIRGLRGARQLA